MKQRKKLFLYLTFFHSNVSESDPENFRTILPNASMPSTRLDRALLKEKFFIYYSRFI